MFKLRSTVRREDLPQRETIRIGGQTVVFANAEDAAAAYVALSNALGGTHNKEVVHIDSAGDKHKDYETCINEDVDIVIEKQRVGTQGEVTQTVYWEERTKCDGHGECSCWRTEDGHECPEGWEEFQDDKGVIRHMCNQCQDKPVAFKEPEQQC